jgi:hypothetical protein
MGKQAIRDIGGIGKESLIFRDGLADMLDVCPKTIARAIDRGELPPPMRICNKHVWTATTLIEFWNQRERDIIEGQSGDGYKAKGKDTKSRILELEQA